MGVAMVKALIKNYDDIEEWYPLTTAIKDLKQHDEKKMVDEICNDDFIEWMYLKIQKIIEMQDATLIQNASTMFSFLISLTDKSAYFCEKIIKNESLLNFIKFIIQNEYRKEIFYESAIIIINNVEFQLAKMYFNDADVKNFLINQIPFDQKSVCLVTLMRLSSMDEIKQFEDEIFTIIPDLIENFESCCKTSEMVLSGYGIEEILKNINVICKSEKVKDVLKENNNLVVTLNKISSDQKFKNYNWLSDEILSLLRKSDNSNELEQ